MPKNFPQQLINSVISRFQTFITKPEEKNPRKSLRQIMIEIWPDKQAHSGLHDCWDVLIVVAGNQRIEYLKEILDSISATGFYSDNPLTIEVIAPNNPYKDVAILSGAGSPEYQCRVEELVALMRRAITLYEQEHSIE